MIVEVRPIKRSKWHGKGEKQDFARPKTLYAQVRDGKYAVELSESRLKELEKETGYNLDTTYKMNETHSFYSDSPGKIQIPHALGEVKTYDTSDPMDAIHVGIIKGHDLVANSKEELDSGQWPMAEFVIYSEEEEAAAKASRIKTKREARDMIENLSPEAQSNLITIITGEDVSEASEDVKMLRTEHIIENEPKAVKKYAVKEIPELAADALLTRLVNYGIVKEQGQTYSFVDTVLGYSREEAIEFLLDENNSSIRQRLEDKLDAR